MKVKVANDVVTRVVDEIMDLYESGGRGSCDTLGYCLACGAESECVEPDAEKYLCEACGEYKVYGAEQILFMYA